jgi:excisionase family DNA binding protein
LGKIKISDHKTGKLVRRCFMNENVWNNKNWLTAEEAAQYIRRSPKTIYNLRCSGVSLGKKPGGSGQLLFSKEELDAYVMNDTKVKSKRKRAGR